MRRRSDALAARVVGVMEYAEDRVKKAEFVANTLALFRRMSPRAAAAWRIPHPGRAPARLVEAAAVSVVTGELRADVKVAAGHAALDSIAATELRLARYCA